MKRHIRTLLVVLGDQLDINSPALRALDPARDIVWMAEAWQESNHVPSSKVRTVLFLSAMRHFREELRAAGWTVAYHQLSKDHPSSLAAILSDDLRRHGPKSVVMIHPGDHRVKAQLQEVVFAHGYDLEFQPDGHFFCDQRMFDEWAEGRKQLRLEHFYRGMRRRHRVLMENGKPTGGHWNYDSENRKTFGKRGPGYVPEPLNFPPDALTQAVIEDVEQAFPEHPGSTLGFDWPVTRGDALRALDDFIKNRLPLFGPYQDAMWTDKPILYHARLSAALNLKLLNPKEVVAAAVEAYERGEAPLASVEGFVRQILGWREYVRGVYWRFMPDYGDVNELEAAAPLPWFYWTAETDMECLRQAIAQTLGLGYAHHIQRLMVTGLFALLLGVEPKQIHEWYLAVYVDAVEWVEMPNTLGMSQWADGGLLASKPYVASGNYINRMSNYCRHCRYQPGEATGDRGCPFTTLYWDFLTRHRERFSKHPRTALQWRNLERLPPEKVREIRNRAQRLRDQFVSTAPTTDSSPPSSKRTNTSSPESG